MKKVFSTIISYLKNLRKRLARKVVLLYAKYNFQRAMERADERYRTEHTMIYVVQQPFEPGVLTTYDRARFKAEKRHIWGRKGVLLTLAGMKAGCYYHTPDKAGNQKMAEKDIKLRRNYFILERLAAAKLL